MRVAALKDDASTEEKKELSRLFNERPMRPAVFTYLTPEWDEMLSFPTSKPPRMQVETMEEALISRQRGNSASTAMALRTTAKTTLPCCESTSCETTSSPCTSPRAPATWAAPLPLQCACAKLQEISVTAFARTRRIRRTESTTRMGISKMLIRQLPHMTTSIFISRQLRDASWREQVVVEKGVLYISLLFYCSH